MYVSDTFTLALQFRAGWSPRSWRTWACPGTGARVDMREGVKGKGGSAGDESQVVMMQPVSPPSVWRAVVQVQQLYLVHAARAVHQLCLTFPPWCLHVVTHRFKGEVGMITLIRACVFPAQVSAFYSRPHSDSFSGLLWHRLIPCSGSQ